MDTQTHQKLGSGIIGVIVVVGIAYLAFWAFGQIF